MRKVIILAFTAGGLLVGAMPLAAQSVPPPVQAGTLPVSTGKSPPDSADMTTATYGDWLLRCRQTPGQKPPRNCEVVQSLVAQGQTAPVAQLAFGRLAEKGPLYFTAVVPINVSFPSAVRIAFDEKDPTPVVLAWTRCLPGGCFASVELTDDVLARWRARNEAGVGFRNGDGQRPSCRCPSAACPGATPCQGASREV
jgi:invasion protein IalB